MLVGRYWDFSPTGAYGRIRVRDPDHHTCSRNELGASEEGGPESGMADHNRDPDRRTCSRTTVSINSDAGRGRPCFRIAGRHENTVSGRL